MRKKIIITGLIFSAVLVALPLHAEVGTFSKPISDMSLVSIPDLSPNGDTSSFISGDTSSFSFENVPFPDPVDDSAKFEWCG